MKRGPSGAVLAPQIDPGLLLLVRPVGQQFAAGQVSGLAGLGKGCVARGRHDGRIGSAPQQILDTIDRSSAARAEQRTFLVVVLGRVVHNGAGQHQRLHAHELSQRRGFVQLGPPRVVSARLLPVPPVHALHREKSPLNI